MTDQKLIYAGIEGDHNLFENAEILLQPVPYDGTSTWGKGADEGFDAFMEATENMEVYDIETNTEVYQRGIHILDPLTEKSSPKAVFEAVCKKTDHLIKTDKFLTFFGGEHSISIGIIKSMYKAHPDITILQLDAHTDLRPDYHGTPYNHACALYDASKHTNLIQVGIRSMDRLEVPYLNRDQCYFADRIRVSSDWMDHSISKMTDKVYITLDLDVLDPSIMPSTGTPEPGGLLWYPLLQYLREVFTHKDVMGFDIVELAPIKDLQAPNFLTAKLYYKMLSYKFENS